MTIRKRLIVSYIAMILIPVILFTIIAALLAWLFFDKVPGTGRWSGGPAHSNPRKWETFDNREQLFAGVKFMSRYDPDRLMDNQLLKETDAALNKLHAGLVVVKDEQVLYISPFVDNNDLHDQWNRIDSDHGRGWRGRNNGQFTVVRHDFSFSDNQGGTIYLLSDINPFIEQVRQFFPLMIVSLLLVIAMTNGLLTYFVSRSIIKPLYMLKRAAERIKEGDLDHGLIISRKDEIGEVGEAFEEMRERLKQSIQAELQYEENRKELISNISHDLKTPITGIKACVEGIRDGIADTEEKRIKYMQMIENKATSMDRLIDELLLFSKLDLKRLPFHYEKIDIAAYLRDMVNELKNDPQKQNVDIRFQEDVAVHPIFVMADVEKLQRVIMNIVENSMKYMNREDKIIQIKLIRREKDAVIRIQDNGSGIESEALPHIFNRFYRVEPSRNLMTGGSGLGLSIVKHIVEEHGGEAWAESKLDEGTTISFTIPLENMVGSGGEST